MAQRQRESQLTSIDNVNTIKCLMLLKNLKCCDLFNNISETVKDKIIKLKNKILKIPRIQQRELNMSKILEIQRHNRLWSYIMQMYTTGFI